MPQCSLVQSSVHAMCVSSTGVPAQCRSIQQCRHPDKVLKCSIEQSSLHITSVSSACIPAQCRSMSQSCSNMPPALLLFMQIHRLDITHIGPVHLPSSSFHALTGLAQQMAVFDCSTFQCLRVARKLLRCHLLNLRGSRWSCEVFLSTVHCTNSLLHCC